MQLQDRALHDTASRGKNLMKQQYDKTPIRIIACQLVLITSLSRSRASPIRLYVKPALKYTMYNIMYAVKTRYVPANCEIVNKLPLMYFTLFASVRPTGIGVQPVCRTGA